MEDNLNHLDLNDSTDVFCNDEVTFYNPSAEINDSDSEDEEENLRSRNIPLEPPQEQNVMNAASYHTQPQEALLKNTKLGTRENVDSAITISQGNHHIYHFVDHY